MSEYAKDTLLQNVFKQLREESTDQEDSFRNVEKRKLDLQVLRRTVDQIWDKYDLDRNGTLDITEARLFIKDTLGALKKKNQKIENFVSSVFVQIDKNRSGSITKYEMTLFLK